MTYSLAKILVNAKGGPIDYKGKNITLSFRHSIESEQEIEFEFVNFNKEVRQGIEVSVEQKKGYVEVNGQKIVSPIFWTDTAPEKFIFKCFSSKDEGTINIWNVWENIEYKGNIDAWIGNSGLYYVDEGNDVFTLHCSNGMGDICFDDLVIRLRFI